MSSFFDSQKNASIRGYILRSLVKGNHFSCLVKSISNKMLACGLIDNPDISDQLYYLQQCDLIEFTDCKIQAFTSLENDAVIRLTADGIRYIENGGKPDMGIDL